MATIIPARPTGKSSRHVLKAYGYLRRLPDWFTAWFSLTGQGTTRPHFLLLWRQRFPVLLQVAKTSQPEVESIVQGDLLATERALAPDQLGAPEADLLDSFAAGIATTLDADQLAPLPLQKLVIFPEVRPETIEQVVLQQSRRRPDLHFLGLLQLGAPAFAERLDALTHADPSPPVLDHLRRAFTPESIVPAEFSPLTIPDRNTKAQLTAGLLDLDQEWCVKNDLYLPSDQHSVVREEHAQLVTGAAGTGKSLVLLYRALLIGMLHPRCRILVLTHNRPLRAELQRRFRLLNDQQHNFEWRTFFGWATKYLGTWSKPPLGPHQTEQIIATLAAGIPKLQNLSTAYLTDEIGWIKDQNIRHRADYLASDRAGRGLPLTRGEDGQRAAVWELLGTYQHHLQHSGSIDWHGVAMRFHDAAVRARQCDFPCYDYIFVDEAQFFAKTWFEIIRAALKPEGRLFLAADPTQGFLRRRQSWLASGIDVRGGRTTRLKRAYRNSQAILSFATAFYRARAALAPEALEEEDLNLPSPEQIAALPVAGRPPEVIRVNNSQDELSRAAKETVALHEAELPAGQLLLLHADSALDTALHRVLDKALGSGLVHDAKKEPSAGAFCQHTTLNAATGLEAPIVFLLGIDALLETEQDPRLDPDERAELIRDHTRKLYMAITRAAQRLVVFCRRPETERFLRDLTVAGK